jgi:hypothetical protein
MRCHPSFGRAKTGTSAHPRLPRSRSLNAMTNYPPQVKHRILTQYQPHCRGKGFKALAQQHGIQGGGRTIKYWYDRWDGTVASLERQPAGAGRPRILSSEEIKQHIGAQVKKKNRLPEPAHYTQLIYSVKEKTGKQVSLRTIQRYGKEEESIRDNRAIKRTREERKHMITHAAKQNILSLFFDIFIYVSSTFCVFLQFRLRTVTASPSFAARSRGSTNRMYSSSTRLT